MRRAASLPANLPSNPNYRKVNPADAPIMILALTSDVQIRCRSMYDAADSILAQKTVAGRRRGAGVCGRRRAPAVTRGGESDGAEQVRTSAWRRCARR